MNLATILHFFNKENAMKIDRIKEEVVNIRGIQNIIIVSILGLIGYFVANFDPTPNLRLVLAVFGVGGLVFLSCVWRYKMQDKLKELEKASKDE